MFTMSKTEKTFLFTVACLVFLLGCWWIRPARYQLALSDGLPLRLDTQSGRVVVLVPDPTSGTFIPRSHGTAAAQP
jgi:hypothetical protein